MKKLNLILFALFAVVATVSYAFGYVDTGTGITLAMAVPAAVSGQQQTQTYASLFDIHKQDFWPELIEKYGDQGIEFIGMLEAMGWSRDIGVEIIQHFEDDWIWDNFAVGAQVGGASTATLTIDASSINADGKFYPQAKDVIEFPNKDSNGNYMQAYVTAVGVASIDVKVVAGATYNIPATTGGQVLFIATNANGEGTGQPTPQVSTWNKYTNTTAILKKTVGISGSEMTNALWWDNYKGKSGYTNMLTMQLDYRLAKAKQGMILTGQKYTGLTDGGKTVTGTEGFFPVVNRVGIKVGYSTWGLASYDAIEKAQSRVYASTKTGLLLAINLDIANENVIADWLKHTNVEFATKTTNKYLFGESDTSEALAVNIGFDYVVKAKRTFAIKRFGAMNDPKTFGTSGFDYPNRGYGFPLQRDNMDVKSKALIPTLCTVYKKLEGYDRTHEVFTTGSANVEKYGNTNDVDDRLLHNRCTMGFEAFAANQLMAFIPN